MHASQHIDTGRLAPGRFIDSDHPAIVAFAAEHGGAIDDPRERSVALYQAVRDGVRYDPYDIPLSPDEMTASAILVAGRGFCVTKAVLYAAVLRAAGIPARIGFADVRNHLSTPRLRALMGTDIFHYHGYTEVGLDGRWVKATPAFNQELCDRFGILPLEFDGREDSVFHPFDRSGQRHMEYLVDHGPRDDLPLEELVQALRTHYPTMFSRPADAPKGDFLAEAGEANS